MKTKRRKKELSEEEIEKRKQDKRRKGRERHWRNTGVSERTINWMKDYGWL